MATACQRYCAAPGCPVLVDSGRCPAHQSAKRKQHDERRGTAASRGYRYDWQRFREWCMHNLLWQEYNGKCALCGYRFVEGREVEWDHIIPLPHGPRLSASNVQPLCNPCNTKKGNGLQVRQGDV